MIYAINNTTKEHRIITGDAREVDDWRNKMQGWHVVKADSDGWIEWSGGHECPLPKGHKYQCTIGIYKVLTEGAMPELLHWQHVARYKPILNQPASEESKKWRGPQDGMPPIGIEVEIRRNDDDWQRAIVVGHHGCRVVVALWGDEIKYDWAVGAGVRPIRTDRERWIEAALKECTQPMSQRQLGKIYDAGLATLPEKTQ